MYIYLFEFVGYQLMVNSAVHCVN